MLSQNVRNQLCSETMSYSKKNECLSKLCLHPCSLLSCSDVCFEVNVRDMSSCLCAHHEGIWGVEVLILHILNLSTGWRCVVSFILWLLSSPEKRHLYPLNGRFGVPQSYLGHFVQETYILLLLRIESWSVYSPWPSHHTNWPITGAAGCYDIFVK
jgi:hypothetical protein